MATVSATLRPAASQSGMYIRSRMSFHLVYGLLTCMRKVNVYCDQRKHGDCTCALETVVGGRKVGRRYSAQKLFIMKHSRRGGHEFSLDILVRGQS